MRIAMISDKALIGRVCSRFPVLNFNQHLSNTVLDLSPLFLLLTGYGAAWQNICHHSIEPAHDARVSMLAQHLVKLFNIFLSNTLSKVSTFPFRCFYVPHPIFFLYLRGGFFLIFFVLRTYFFITVTPAIMEFVTT